jgi:hypothetical protein
MPGMLKRAYAVAILAAVLFNLPACAVYTKPKSGFAGATGGEQLERQFWNDIKAKDWKDLAPRLAPSFTFSSATGARDRAASMELWKAWNLESVTLSEVQVQSAGADFVVTASVTIAGTRGGQAAPAQPIHTMTVWQQVSKGFVAVAHSEAE